jgi:hypothetical protein
LRNDKVLAKHGKYKRISLKAERARDDEKNFHETKKFLQVENNINCGWKNLSDANFNPQI